MLRRSIVEHAWPRNVGHHRPEQNNGAPAQAARRVAVTAASNVRKLVLSGHSGTHGTDEVDCALDVDIYGLGEHVELQVWSDSTGDVAQLRKINTLNTTSQPGSQQRELWGLLTPALFTA